MADKLLSILESTLTGIANAIRSKGGTSAKLSFPTGMVNAINAIETEANITPKITAQTRYLTTSQKSVNIEPGFHDGSGSVKIRLQSKSATPSASQQNITPDSGYFLSSVSVGGIGSGTRVYVGTKTVSSRSDTVTVSGLPFTPTGVIFVLIDGNGSTKAVTCASTLTKYPYKDSGHDTGSALSTVLDGKLMTGNISASISGSSFKAGKQGISKYYGKYLYVIWDGDP